MPTAIRRAPVARCRWAVLAALAMLAGLVAAAPAQAERIPSDHGTIVGVREGADAAAVARALRRAGMATHPLPRIDALLAPRAGAAAVRRVLGDDRRVRWIEATVSRTLLAEPSAAVDPTTGRPFDWAFDAVAAGQAIAAAGGGRPSPSRWSTAAWTRPTPTWPAVSPPPGTSRSASPRRPTSSGTARSSRA